MCFFVYILNYTGNVLYLAVISGYYIENLGFKSMAQVIVTDGVYFQELDYAHIRQFPFSEEVLSELASHFALFQEERIAIVRTALSEVARVKIVAESLCCSENGKSFGFSILDALILEKTFSKVLDLAYFYYEYLSSTEYARSLSS